MNEFGEKKSNEPELMPGEKVLLMPCSGYKGVSGGVVERDHTYKATTDRLHISTPEVNFGWFSSLEQAQVRFMDHPVEISDSHSICSDCLALYDSDLDQLRREQQAA